MKEITLSALMFAAMSSAAAAEPRTLADAEMAGVVGGLYDFIVIMPVTVVVSNANSTAIGVQSEGVNSTALSNVNVRNIIGIDKTDQVIGVGIPGVMGAPGGFWPWAEPRSGQVADRTSPFGAAMMISGMLWSRYLGPGW